MLPAPQSLADRRPKADGRLNHLASGRVAGAQNGTTPLQNTEYSDVLMIFEDSQRGNKLNPGYFNRYHIERTLPDDTTERVQMRKAVMSKSEREPGLEVADFVAHTAGASVRSRLSGTRTKANERKDFSAIFGYRDRRLVSFLEVTKVEDDSDNQ